MFCRSQYQHHLLFPGVTEILALYHAAWIQQSLCRLLIPTWHVHHHHPKPTTIYLHPTAPHVLLSPPSRPTGNLGVTPTDEAPLSSQEGRASIRHPDTPPLSPFPLLFPHSSLRCKSGVLAFLFPINRRMPLMQYMLPALITLILQAQLPIIPPPPPPPPPPCHQTGRP